MRKIFYILPFVGVFFYLTACEGHYRYPCQDPANWDKLECNNEVCKAEGTCTADVLAPAGSREFGADLQQNPLQDSADEITTDTCQAPVEQPDYEDNSKKVDFRVKRIEAPRDRTEVMDPEGDEYESPTPTAPAEQPLSMNTIVDTAAHNAAVK
jgi:sirohydrochlorin ferrochelatase